MNLKIIKTSDGSDTIFNQDLNETYHSLNGSIKESELVYIRNGLEFFLDKKTTDSVRVLEIGFGTGLNFLLTKIFMEERNEKLFYHTLEPFPLPSGLLKKINYIEKLGEGYRNIFDNSHRSRPNETVNLNEKITFLRSDLTLESIKFSKKYDVIYFDAFAPSRQPEIWEKENLKKIYSHMNLNSILVTYCSSGQFKRDLRGVGFDVDVLPGPVGKREMVRAIK